VGQSVVIMQQLNCVPNVGIRSKKMTSLEAIAIDYVKAKLAEREAFKAYNGRLMRLSMGTENTEDDPHELSKKYHRFRKEAEGLEAAMISHVKAAYADELESTSKP
jgi:hypothetical protein